MPHASRLGTPRLVDASLQSPLPFYMATVFTWPSSLYVSSLSMRTAVLLDGGPPPAAWPHPS